MRPPMLLPALLLHVCLPPHRGAAQTPSSAPREIIRLAGGSSLVVRVAMFVSSAPGFHDQPKVANGASDLLVKIFGEEGRHVRAAVGVNELPLNSCVEIELTVEAA